VMKQDRKWLYGKYSDPGIVLSKDVAPVRAEPKLTEATILWSLGWADDYRRNHLPPTTALIRPLLVLPACERRYRQKEYEDTTSHAVLLPVEHDLVLKALTDFVQTDFVFRRLGNIEASKHVQRRSIADDHQRGAELRRSGTIRGSQPHNELVAFHSEYSLFSEMTDDNEAWVSRPKKRTPRRNLRLRQQLPRRKRNDFAFRNAPSDVALARHPVPHHYPIRPDEDGRMMLELS
jgi:hypothetical protein